MKIWANLATIDVERARRFYTELGFEPNGSLTPELASFLVGEDDFVLHFFVQKRFESSAEGQAADLSDGNEVMFTLSADSTDEVDRWCDDAERAGGSILFDPRKDDKELYTDNGFYTCVFADPDGHKFNVFHNAGAEA